MFKLIYRKFGDRLQAKDDLLSGLTVALALVPEAVAFAIIAGVSPIIGLYAAFMACLITAILGGRPGMISRSNRGAGRNHGLPRAPWERTRRGSRARTDMGVQYLLPRSFSWESFKSVAAASSLDASFA